MKLLEKNTAVNVHDLGVSNKIHRKDTRNKRKIGKLNFIKIKNSCTLKNTIKKVKRLPTE